VSDLYYPTGEISDEQHYIYLLGLKLSIFLQLILHTFTEHLARRCVAGNRACLRCAASWYCEGDGNKSACGRCDPPQSNSTCGKSPTEHSFGYRAECEPCPVGWV